MLYPTKLASEQQATNKGYYYHTTRHEVLDKVLGSDRTLRSIKRLAVHDPGASGNVEYIPGMVLRQESSAEDAVRDLAGKKDIDRIFMTRDGYLPGYGDVVIRKEYADRTVKRRAAPNFIPNEYTTARDVKITGGTRVYVPDSSLESYASKYPGLSFRPISKLDERKITVSDRVKSWPGNVKDWAMSKLSSIRSEYGRNAMLVGSEALGLNVPGSSDRDVYVLYKTDRGFRNAVAAFPEKHPGFVMTAPSMDRDDRKVFTGIAPDGVQTDVALAYGPKADRFYESFQAAKLRAASMDREAIIKRKQELKNAWFLPGHRYKRYKRQLDNELGLAKF